MATVSQLPAALDLECVAGQPFVLTLTCTGATVTSAAAAIYTSAGTAASSGAPTVSTAASVVTVTWSTTATTNLWAERGSRNKASFLYAVTGNIDGDGPFGLIARKLTVHPPGTAGVSTSSSASLTVTAGGADVSLALTIGGRTLDDYRWRPAATGLTISGRTAAVSFGSNTGGNTVKRAVAAVEINGAVRVGWANITAGTTEQSSTNSPWTITAATIEYPSGTFTPILFDGNVSSSSVSAGGIAWGEAYVKIPKGAPFWIRSYYTFSSSSSLNSHTIWPNSLTGESADSSSSPTDKSQTAGSVGSNAHFIHPSSILTLAPATTIAIGIGGDSIGAGYGEGIDPNRGFAGYACEGVLPVMKIAANGSRAQYVAAVATRWRQWRLLEGCTHFFEQWGTNDISNGRTVAQLQTDHIAIWVAAKAMGIRYVHVGTVVPRTTTTDRWATLANQTVIGNESVRTGYNSWLRDGAPITSAADPTAIAVDATGLRMGETGHPLTGVVDIAAAVEVDAAGAATLNGGLWKVAVESGREVADAAITSGAATLTSATASFVAGDVGRMVIIEGAGTAGAQFASAINSVTNSTTAVLVNNAGTTVTGATCRIGGVTADGIHPSWAAHQAMATAFTDELIDLYI